MTKKIIIWALSLTLVVYVVVCTVLYFVQIDMMFLPKKLDQNFEYSYEHAFSERNFTMSDGVNINALHFTQDSTKGLIFYLHGNSGALDTWGFVADAFLSNDYDVLVMDYRGFGKSGGQIDNEERFGDDVLEVYESMSQEYSESNIIVVGYSIGTGFAAKVASVKNPKRLILQAPYYSMEYLVKSQFPLVPSFVLKFKIPTHLYLQTAKCPITIFHGEEDEIIGFESSLLLSEEFKAGDELVSLKNQGHHGVSVNEVFISRLKELLIE